jgi:predicted transcriptional regulator
MHALKLQALRLGYHDLRFALGDLEAIVLQQLWKLDGPVSVRDLHPIVSSVHPVAVTTVATILDRLHRKDLVSRELVREAGPHYLYRTRVTEMEFKHAIVDDVMGALLRSFNDITVAYLAERMCVDSPNDLRALSKYLNRLRRRTGK